MPIVFRNLTIVFEAGTGRRDVVRTETFESRVRSADAAIKGFSLDHVEGDHPINIVAVDLDILRVEDKEVELLVQAMYGDKDLNDPYLGFVNVLLIADIEPSLGLNVPTPDLPVQG